jgi:hypothetical protein
MRNFGVLAAIVLSGMAASCAERVVPAANIASPPPEPPKATSSRHSNPARVDRLAAPARQIVASARTERRPKARASNSPPFRAPRKPWYNPPSVAAPSPLLEPPEPSVPAVVSLPLPSEPAEPTFPLALHPIESAPIGTAVPAPPDPAAPTLPSAPPAMTPGSIPVPAAPPVSGASPEAMMPPLPEPAEPSFPIAALMMPQPSEPAEASLPEQDADAAGTSVSIPFPELTENLSLNPRSDSRDVTQTFSLPHSPMSGAFHTNPEEKFPSLVRDPWPLPIEP